MNLNQTLSPNMVADLTNDPAAELEQTLQATNLTEQQINMNKLTVQLASGCIKARETNFTYF